MNASEISLLSTPLGFVQGVLGLPCYCWSQRILCDLDQPGKVSVRAANGVGKTSRVGAPSAIWNAAVHPGSLTLCSAGVYRQVGELLHAIHEHRAKLPAWEFLSDEVRTPQKSRILGFTADRPELFEGFHSDHLLIILDEAKAIPDSIYAAALRCQPERLLLLSSPGPTSGFFYDSFHKNRRFFRTHVVTALEAEHVSKTWIEEVIAQFGEDHPYTRSAVYAEFMAMDGDTPIPLGLVEKLLANPPALTGGSTKAFCDFGAGQAENVLAVRRGNKVAIAAAWREADTSRAIGQFLKLFRQLDLKPEDIEGDADGMGIVFIDMLTENKFPIRKFHGGRPARNSKVYANAVAELWYEARRAIERREIILPNDQTLIGQLTSRKGSVNSKGLLCLESKEDMRKRGLVSPDRADAGTWAR